MIRIELLGYIVSDAVIKRTEKNTEYLYFRFAANDNSRRDSNDKPKPRYFTITSFDQQHIKLCPYLAKGRQLLLRGNHTLRSYFNRDQNKETYNEDVKLTELDFVGEKRKNEEKTKSVTPPTETDDLPF